MDDASFKLFFSYSHKDEALRNELVNHLHILTRQGLITSWHDRKILPGDDWHHQIHGQMETADIILLLVSADFIASDYCLDIEVETALRRHDAGDACVIPIVLRPVDWTGAPFAKLQALPTNAKPATVWPDRDEAFLDIAQGIRKIAEQLQAQRRQHWEEKQRVHDQYKQKMEEILSSSDGHISVIARDTLDELRETLRITPDEAQAIEACAFEPYKIYEEKLAHYQRSLLKVIDQYPFSEAIKRELEYRQRDLGIKGEDVERIQQPLFAAAEAQYQAQLSRNQQECAQTVQAPPPLDPAGCPSPERVPQSGELNDGAGAHRAATGVPPREIQPLCTPLDSACDTTAEAQPYRPASTLTSSPTLPELQPVSATTQPRSDHASDTQPHRSTRLSFLQKMGLYAGGSMAVVCAVVLVLFSSGETPQSSEERITQHARSSSSSPTTSQLTAKDFYQSGEAKFQQQDYQGALTEYTQAIALDPAYAPAYNGRGRVRFAQGDKDGAREDDHQAASLYTRAADQGDASAQSALGDFYRDGRGGLPQDDRQAASLYTRAADQGDASAQSTLGDFYRDGRGGLPQADQKAASLYTRAADKGNAAAQANLGFFYETGQGGLPQNDQMAVSLYKRAAAQGDASAQVHLGLFYAAGQGGLPQDDRMAVSLYTRAAAQGSAAGQAFLGEYYETGQGGLPQDDQMAVSLYKRAAAKNNPAAQAKLGFFYETGRGGLPQNNQKAVSLYKLAADQGVDFAISALDRLDKARGSRR